METVVSMVFYSFTQFSISMFPVSCSLFLRVVVYVSRFLFSVICAYVYCFLFPVSCSLLSCILLSVPRFLFPDLCVHVFCFPIHPN